MGFTSTLAIVFYAFMALAVGISIFLGRKAELEKQDWLIYAAGPILGALVGFAAKSGLLGSMQQTIAWEMSMGYWTSLITWPGAMKIGLIPIGIPGPAWFAIAFLLLARGRWGGDVGRYFEIAAIGLIIQAATYVVHLTWHFQQTGGPSTLPAWGFSPAFWFVVFHGGAALSFGLIAYAFYGYWQSTK